MIYGIMSQKGGAGKTTIAYNLAYYLTDRKKKVLLVDADQQCNSCTALGVETVKYSLVDVFKGKVTAKAAIIPGKIDLLAATGEIMGEKIKYDRLQKALSGLEYDYIIIDCPPGFTDITKSALLAVDRVILPVNMDVFGLESIAQFKGIFDEAKEVNTDLKISGIVRCKYIERRKLTKIVDDNLKDCSKHFGIKIYKTPIRECVSIVEAEYMQQSIFEYAPKCKAAQDMTELFKEILKDK